MALTLVVMAGLVPAIHDSVATRKGVDARHKAGHDGGEIGVACEATA